MQNLASDPQYAAMRKQLEADLRGLIEELADPVDAPALFAGEP